MHGDAARTAREPAVAARDLVARRGRRRSLQLRCVRRGARPRRRAGGAPRACARHRRVGWLRERQAGRAGRAALRLSRARPAGCRSGAHCRHRPHLARGATGATPACAGLSALGCRPRRHRAGQPAGTLDRRSAFARERPRRAGRGRPLGRGAPRRRRPAAGDRLRSARQGDAGCLHRDRPQHRAGLRRDRRRRGARLRADLRRPACGPRSRALHRAQHHRPAGARDPRHHRALAARRHRRRASRRGAAAPNLPASPARSTTCSTRRWPGRRGSRSGWRS